MKVGCVNISSDILIGKTQNDNVPYLSKLLLDCGVSLSNIFVVENNPQQLSTILTSIDHDILIIIGEDNPVKNFNIKNILATFWNEDIVKSEHCVNFVNSYLKKENIQSIPQIENEYYIPSNAIPLNNASFYLQGFMYDGGKTTYIFLPNYKDSIRFLYENSIMPIISRIRQIALESVTINTFGISEKEILLSLKDLINNDYKISISTYANDLDVSIVVRYNALTPNEIINVFVSKIYEKLRKFIYADGETSLYQMALDLMTISNKTLAIAETITGGNICSEFNKCSSPSKNLILEGRILNNQYSQKSLLNVNTNVVTRYGTISVETAYELATSLLETSNADLVLVTCGDIDGESNICYLAIGDMDGIHVYKNTYSGAKDKVISTVSKCGVFYLIKKLKQNDLFFNTITV